MEPNFIKGRQMFALSYDNFITLNIVERILIPLTNTSFISYKK